MIRSEFEQLLRKALADMISDVEKRFGKPLPSNLQFELHGAGVSGEILNFGDLIEEIYISEDMFWWAIDIAVKEVLPTKTKIFVRVSSESPVAYKQTYNFDKGLGPFKIMYVVNIKFKEET